MLKIISLSNIYHRHNDYLMPVEFEPKEWGFVEVADKDFVNTELFIHNQVQLTGYKGGGEVEENAEGEKEYWEVDGVAIFSHFGYQVRKVDTEEWIIDGSEINEDGCLTGLQYVHEYQNLYTAEFPNKTLNLTPITTKLTK